MLRLVIVLAALVSLLAPSGLAAQPQTLVSSGDAYVSRDERNHNWTVGSSGIALTVGFDRAGDFRLLRLLDPAANREWDVDLLPDTFVTVRGRRLSLGSRRAGYAFRSFSAASSDHGVELALVFDLRDARLRVTRHYASYSRAPVIETWTTLISLDSSDSIAVSDLNAWELTASGVGSVRWVTGLQTSDAEGGSFTARQRALAPGERIDLGARGRSSELFVPIFATDLEGGQLVGGIMWSGAWSAAIERIDQPQGKQDWTRMTVGLPEMSTDIAPGASLELPHGFFGATAGGREEVSAALAAFIRGLRGGRTFLAPVTFNTWFAHGTRIEDANMREEISHVAADLNGDVFVLDAGWYAGATDAFDFTSGLGSWSVDRSRFPGGLRPLAEDARSRGLRFGIWVEPERVDLATVNRPGLAREHWLATRDGRYDSTLAADAARAGQICLADAEARRWVLERLVAFVEDVRPDYLKWDNNFWVNCNRSGHGHGPTDGNFSHVKGLYELLGVIRERYPTLFIENVSGGGNRLDLGMMRFSDAGWMDDRSAPSAHVRHNLEGLSAFFPPAYLFSFVMNHEAESMHGAADLSLLCRSRMAGMLGLSFRVGELSEGETAQIVREVAIYKSIREVLRDASAFLLTDQVPHRAGGRWDAVQAVSATSGDAILFAFEGPDAADRVTIRPRRLAPEASYQVESVDLGRLGVMSGADLMDQGIEILSSPTSAAHILVFRLVAGISP